MAFFPISSMVSGLLVHLQIIQQFDRIAGAFNGSGFTQTVALDISKAFFKVDMLVIFIKSSLMKCQVKYLVFSHNRQFEWFWMRPK